MTKELLIAVLIITFLYLYYQQTQPKTLTIQPSNQELQDLKSQVQHYQTLYQKRVEKDLEVDQSEKINKLEERITLYQQKAESLEQELFTLAQKKLLIKKESQELFKK